MSTEPGPDAPLVDVAGNELDPVRVEDGQRLAAIADLLEKDYEGSLGRSIVHPHAIMDAALERVAALGLAQDDHRANAALIGLWVDGFMTGERAMAGSIGIDLDEDLEQALKEDGDEPKA